MNAKWILVLVIMILLIGGGISYWMGLLPTSQVVTPPEPQGPVSPLRIEEQEDPAFGESGVEAHRDLSCQNQPNNPLTVKLVASDCECAHVTVCVTPDEWKALDSDAFLKRAAEPALSWHVLKIDGASFTIPPLAHGMIRVTWKAFKVGASAIKIDLIVDDGENKVKQRFKVPVNFFAPVWLCAEGNYSQNDIDIGHLKPGEQRTTHILCCSTTRKKFTIFPAPPIEDPCIVYGTPQPLTAKEIEAMPKAPNGEPVLAAFRVPITMKGRAGDKQFDIGPFHCPIVYKTDFSSEFKTTAFLDGISEGEVGLAGSEGKDFIDLGLVPPTRPQPVTFTLHSRDPQMQLSVDEQRTLDFLKLELLDGKDGKPTANGKSWRVRAIFRTDALFRGPIPNANHEGYTTAAECSVVFFVSRPGTKAARVRRLFVPVRGTIRGY